MEFSLFTYPEIISRDILDFFLKDSQKRRVEIIVRDIMCRWKKDVSLAIYGIKAGTNSEKRQEKNNKRNRNCTRYQ